MAPALSSGPSGAPDAHSELFLALDFDWCRSLQRLRGVRFFFEFSIVCRWFLPCVLSDLE